MKNIRLFWKLNFTYVLISLLSFFLIYIFTTFSLRQFYLQQTKTFLETQTRMLSQSLDPEVVNWNAEQVQSYLYQLGTAAQVWGWSVVDIP